MKKIKVALAGQPNCGKSTIFNLVSGIEQKIANYPGVTVDKKVGFFRYEDYKIEMIDLPGTYSFNSYSLEEKVAKEAILEEKPDIIVNVVDASNLKRNLYLTFQLLEIGKPVVIVLNMMDVAKRRGIEIEINKISSILKCPVIAASGAKGLGGKEIMQSIVSTYKNINAYEEFKIDYGELEVHIAKVENRLKDIDTSLSKRFMAIKAIEDDSVITKAISLQKNDVQDEINVEKSIFSKEIAPFLASLRYECADIVVSKTVVDKNKNKETLTAKVDKIVLNRFLAIPILLGIIYLIYKLAIVYGYKLTDYTWPYLSKLKTFVIDISPQPYFTDVTMLADFNLWMINSALALLNYLPIFFILFALIAILEDSGYMPRIAFILDKIFKKFGLHGQSTLPMVLGGAMVGGCAVPGIMSTKGIADDKARMATILIVPYMNCLAKVPFYTLILGAFFKPDMALMMFFISTVTLFTALIVAKIITSLFLKTRESAPFVMELPPYHLPTFKSVVISSVQRVWVYIKKVVTIVLAVAVVLFAMLQFPGLSDSSKAKYELQSQEMLANFQEKVSNSNYYQEMNTKDKVSNLLNYYDNYRTNRMSSTSKEGSLAIDEEYKNMNPIFFTFIKPGKNKEARVINREIRKLSTERKRFLREIKNEKIENSLLGMAGKAIEPITQFAGFDWKINVAFLSSFAARESAVATIGSLYENNQATSQRAEEAMAETSGYTPLHATSILIFMLLSPPCIASMIVVKLQTNSYKWMMFAIFFPFLLGICISSLVFTLGVNFNWTGLEAMQYYYFALLFMALILGLLPTNKFNWRGGLSTNLNQIKGDGK